MTATHAPTTTRAVNEKLTLPLGASALQNWAEASSAIASSSGDNRSSRIALTTTSTIRFEISARALSTGLPSSKKG